MTKLPKRKTLKSILTGNGIIIEITTLNGTFGMIKLDNSLSA